MRRIVIATMSTITTLVLLFSYHTSTTSTAVAQGSVVQAPASSEPAPTSSQPAPTPSETSPSATSPSSPSDQSNSSTSTPSPTSSARAAASASYAGDIADTRWGPVQVQITVRGGKITRSEAIQYPQGNGRDAQINGYALPILNQEVVQQQGASIDTVSGATVTSDGYLQSLQSAIDQAHL